MIRRPPRSTRTDTLFPSPTLFRSSALTALLLCDHGVWQATKRCSEPRKEGVQVALIHLSAKHRSWRNREHASSHLRVKTPIRYKLRPRQQNKQRSEEHTSELQSLMRISYAVFCLKKKKTKNN